MDKVKNNDQIKKSLFELNQIKIIAIFLLLLGIALYYTSKVIEEPAKEVKYKNVNTLEDIYETHTNRYNYTNNSNEFI